jgi:hypothetical protein
LVFERRVLRKIYGPTQDKDGTWRMKTNAELETLIKREHIVRFIKSQRLQWAAHVIRMDPLRTVKKLTLSVPAEYMYFAASHASHPDGVLVLRDFRKVVK